jgi:hypothetical protein
VSRVKFVDISTDYFVFRNVVLRVLKDFLENARNAIGSDFFVVFVDLAIEVFGRVEVEGLDREALFAAKFDQFFV